ncbi:arsenite methyltransferase-like [Discoglossus pictus]
MVGLEAKCAPKLSNERKTKGLMAASVTSAMVLPAIAPGTPADSSGLTVPLSATGAACTGAPLVDGSLHALFANPPIHEPISCSLTDYYGRYVKNAKDLQTNACLTNSNLFPKYVRDALADVHQEVSMRSLGCGVMAPGCLENCIILDLGSGSEQDCYMLSKLVGPNGHVTGIDMADEQLEMSRRLIDYHMKKFGFQKPNVDFIKRYIEDLRAVNLQDESYDIIISNCVISLSLDKNGVLREAYRVLKDGGEMYFSDMYINRIMNTELQHVKELWGEGISGALTWNGLSQIAKEIGFSPPRLVTSRHISVNKELQNIIGDYKLVSATFRLFKLPQDAVKEKSLAIYNGGVTGCEDELQFDANFTFKVGEAVEVDEELVLF